MLNVETTTGNTEVRVSMRKFGSAVQNVETTMGKTGLCASIQEVLMH